MIVTEPIDDIHRESIAWINKMRKRLAKANRIINNWQPRPYPPLNQGEEE